MDKRIIIPTKQQQLNIINLVPDSVLFQFFKISAAYLTFMNNVKKNKSLSTRGKYISDSEMSLMMLHNMIALSSNGKTIEQNIFIDKEKSESLLSEIYLNYLNSMNTIVDPENEITPNSNIIESVDLNDVFSSDIKEEENIDYSEVYTVRTSENNKIPEKKKTDSSNTQAKRARRTKKSVKESE